MIAIAIPQAAGIDILVRLKAYMAVDPTTIAAMLINAIVAVRTAVPIIAIVAVHTAVSIALRAIISAILAVRKAERIDAAVRKAERRKNRAARDRTKGDDMATI